MKSYELRDAELIKEDALPNNASTTVNGTAIDLGIASGQNSSRLAPCELLLSAPALTTTMLPSTKTMTYSLQCDEDSAFGSPRTLVASCITQTGTASSGAAAAAYRMKLPSDCERYIRAVAVSGDSVTDSSSKKMKLELLF